MMGKMTDEENEFLAKNLASGEKKEKILHLKKMLSGNKTVRIQQLLLKI